MRNWLRNFMIGRYGYDQLGKFLTVSSFILFLISMFFVKSIVSNIIWYAGLIIMIYAYFRMLSKNRNKRYGENLKYLKIRNKVTQKFRGLKNRVQQRKTHKFFRCPQCKVVTRVPKGKGTIKITCPRCGNSFIKKT